MMNDDESRLRLPTRWETFRFSVVGPLLAAPPERGELREAISALAAKTWRHPITGERVRFSFATLERWYYKARSARVDPVGALVRKVRSDYGTQPAMPKVLRDKLCEQYRAHPSWSYQLHADNLAVIATDELKLEHAPSYPTVRRFMHKAGLRKRRRRGPRQGHSPGAALAEARFESREVRSYESAYVNALWHADYHHGSLKVLQPDGTWVTPVLLGILDDRSRLCCHVQWYLRETAENFVHGLSQALLKRGMPRSLLTDNGSAMTAAETEQGLGRLGIIADTTLPYSPEQNAKQERFWMPVEGRLLQMLEGVPELTLSLLNEATLAWVELEYNRKEHSEIGQAPVERYLAGPDVGREAVSSDLMRQAFTQQVTRKLRRTDGTLTIEGVRFEVPSRYRTLDRLRLRYASWDLSVAWLFDKRTDAMLCPLYPLDKERHADGVRRDLAPLDETLVDPEAPPPGGIAPLLRRLMAEYAATGMPPAYIPRSEHVAEEEEEHDG